MIARRLLRFALLVLMAMGCLGPAGGCRNDRSEPPVATLTKPLSQLTGDDIDKAVTSMGWTVKGVALSENNEVSAITVNAWKEHPSGIELPDGGKRLQLLVTIHKDTPELAKTRPAQLTKSGAAYRRDGLHTLSVALSSNDAGEAKRILDQLIR